MDLVHQEALGHQDPLLDLVVLDKYLQALQGLLWGLASHCYHEGLSQKSQIHSLEVHQVQGIPQRLDVQGPQVGLEDQYHPGIL